MKLDNNRRAFFELLRAGLWGDQRSVQEIKSLKVQDSVDWKKVHLLAQEQSVVGHVLQGIEWFKNHNLNADHDLNVPKVLLLQWIGEVQVIEQRNKAMNAFVAALIDKLRKEGVYAVLVKGQGIAQCYEKPLWRSSGDVDLLLSSDDYEKAKKVLLPLATDVETEYSHFKHQGMTIDGWVVELHGTMHSRLSKRVDRVIDDAQNVVFNLNDNHNHNENGVRQRVWMNGHTDVVLPGADEDVIFVFTHILHHFFFEGIGLRQICDWCRLLWTYRVSLNHGLLESRIRDAGLMTEWKAFAALAVNWLGMPVEAMPLYVSEDQNVQEFKKFKRKAEKICEFVLEVGNFGHNKMVQGSSQSEAAKPSARSSKVQGYFHRKFLSFWVRLSDMLRHFTLFPKDSIVFFGGVLRSGLHAAVRGE